ELVVENIRWTEEHVSEFAAVCGGGVHVAAFRVHLDNCTFRNVSLQGSQGGGGGACLQGPHSTVSLARTTFEANAARSGGALMVLSTVIGVYLREVNFTGNTAQLGAAVFLHAGPYKLLMDTLFASAQTAAGWGDFLYWHYSSWESHGESPRMPECTGGGCHCLDGCQVFTSSVVSFELQWWPSMEALVQGTVLEHESGTRFNPLPVQYVALDDYGHTIKLVQDLTVTCTAAALESWDMEAGRYVEADPASARLSNYLVPYGGEEGKGAVFSKLAVSAEPGAMLTLRFTASDTSWETLELKLALDSCQPGQQHIAGEQVCHTCERGTIKFTNSTTGCTTCSEATGELQCLGGSLYELQDGFWLAPHADALCGLEDVDCLLKRMFACDLNGGCFSSTDTPRRNGNGSMEIPSEVMCADGHRADVVLCASCDMHYHGNGGSCSACPTGALVLVQPLLVLAIVLLLVALLMWYMRRVMEDPVYLDRRTQLHAMWRTSRQLRSQTDVWNIFLTHLQVLGQTALVLEDDMIPYPLNELLDAISLVNLPLLRISGLTCMLDQYTALKLEYPFYFHMVLHATLPFLIALPMPYLQFSGSVLRFRNQMMRGTSRPDRSRLQACRALGAVPPPRQSNPEGNHQSDDHGDGDDQSDDHGDGDDQSDDHGDGDDQSDDHGDGDDQSDDHGDGDDQAEGAEAEAEVDSNDDDQDQGAKAVAEGNSDGDNQDQAAEAEAEDNKRRWVANVAPPIATPDDEQDEQAENDPLPMWVLLYLPIASFVLIFIHPTCSTYMFQIFNCHRFYNESDHYIYYLELDRNVQCFTSFWWLHAALSVFVIIVYVVGFPASLLFMFVYWHSRKKVRLAGGEMAYHSIRKLRLAWPEASAEDGNRGRGVTVLGALFGEDDAANPCVRQVRPKCYLRCKKGEERLVRPMMVKGAGAAWKEEDMECELDDPAIFLSLGALFMPYRRQFFYWTLYDMLRRLLQSSVVTLVRIGISATYDVLFGYLVCYVALCIHSYVQPYKNMRSNILQMYVLFVQGLVLLAILITDFQGTGSEESTPVGVVLFCIILLITGVLLVFLIKHYVLPYRAELLVKVKAKASKLMASIVAAPLPGRRHVTGLTSSWYKGTWGRWNRGMEYWGKGKIESSHIGTKSPRSTEIRLHEHTRSLRSFIDSAERSSNLESPQHTPRKASGVSTAFTEHTRHKDSVVSTAFTEHTRHKDSVVSMAFTEKTNLTIPDTKPKRDERGTVVVNPLCLASSEKWSSERADAS
ncbi:hypothetical protein CYMTET_37797, partial [Cymbomonas tetramitiformis]